VVGLAAESADPLVEAFVAVVQERLARRMER
jgi:hypothetical protein